MKSIYVTSYVLFNDKAEFAKPIFNQQILNNYRT